MSLEIDEAALDGILNQVSEELAPILKSEAQKLNKEESGSPEESSGSASGEGEASASGGGEDGPPGADASAGAPPADASASAAPPAGPPGASPSAPPAASPSAGMPTDPAQMAQMVAQMPPEAVKALYLAAKQALFAAAPPAAPDMSAGPGAPPAGPSAPPMAPPAGPPPDASAGAPPMDPAMGKGEFKASPGNGGKLAVKKSEADPEIAELKKALKEQGEALEAFAKAFTRMASTPQRRAVTSVAALAKSEESNEEPKPMSKSELNARLSEQIKSGKLEKKDKEAVRRFYDTGSTNVNLVKHLL